MTDSGLWREEVLSAVAEVRISNVDKHLRPGEVLVKLCNYLDAYANEYLGADYEFATGTATHRELADFGLRSGDIVLTKDSETPDDIGVAAVLDAVPPNLVCGYHLAIIRPRASMNPVWLMKLFNSDTVRLHLAQRAAGSTRYGLSRSSLAGVPVPIAPRADQDCAAEILRCLDQTIAETERLIAKLEVTKRGLLHDLLTRGIDENGELRDPERHPAQFVETALGRIPADWKVTRLVEVGTLPTGQVDPKLEPYRSWTLVAPDHIESGTGRLLVKESAESQGAISGKYLVQSGDVLYSKIRPHLRKATLADFKGLCSADMYPLRPGDRIRSRILLAVLLGEHFSRFAESVSMRSGFPKINRNELRGYWFALPPVSEQDRMDQILSAQEGRLASEASLLEKLRLLKRGLTRELLSGRVRVTNLLEGDAA